METSGVGGTHPALVEAMAFGNCVVAHNTPENLETIAEAGFAYDGQVGAESLSTVLYNLLNNLDLVLQYRSLAEKRARLHYTWEAVTDAYERLFYRTCNHSLPERLM